MKDDTVNDNESVKRSVARKRQGLLIVGMHRSGTSLTAGIMCHIGAAAPASLMAAYKFNETGYWESNRFYKLNERILNDAGSSWHDIMPIDPSFFSGEGVEVYIREICSAIEVEYEEKALICVKDPRIARLLPLWLAAFERLGIEPLLVVPQRNPLEVAASLKRRNDFALPHAQMLWMRYVLDCERHSRGLKRSFVAYEDLLSDWRGCITYIANDLGLVWPKLQHRSAAQVDKMVSTHFQHHSVNPKDLKDHTYISSLVWLTSQSLINAASGNRADPQRELKKIAYQMDAADQLYAELLADKEIDLDIERDAKAVARKAADEEKATHAVAEKAFTEARAAAQEHEQAHQQELKQQVGNLSATTAELKKVKSEVTNLTVKLELRSDEIAKLTQLLHVSENKAAKTSAEQKKEVAAHQQESASQNAENASLKPKLDAAAAERDNASAQPSKLTKKLDHASANADKYIKEAQALRQECETLKSDIANLTQKNEARVRELVQLTQILQDSDEELDELREQLSRYQLAAAKAVGRAIARLVGFSAAKVPTDAELAVVSQNLTEARLFDPEYYCVRYADVVEAAMDPVMHYLMHGAVEGRTPFDIGKIVEEEVNKEIGNI